MDEEAVVDVSCFYQRVAGSLHQLRCVPRILLTMSRHSSRSAHTLSHNIHYIMFAGRELVVYGRINVSMVCIDYTAVNL